MINLATCEDALGNKLILDSKASIKGTVISIPEQTIVPGMPYTITLKDGISFVKEELKFARSITFVTDREDIEEIEYKDNVYQLGENEVASINIDTLQLPTGSGIKTGDIIIQSVGGGQNISAYYVESVSADGIAKTRKPSPDEIYKKLDISGTYSINPDDIVLDEEAIAKQVRESTFVDSLVRTVYAGEDNAGELDIKVKILPKKDNLLRVQIDFTLNDAFEWKGKKKDAVMTLVLGFCADVNVDVVGALVYDVSSDILITADITGDLKFECSDGISFEVDDKGNITFTGELPEEFKMTVRYKNPNMIAEINCVKMDIKEIYRNYVNNTLIPKYGLADSNLINKYMSDEYWGDMSSASGLFSSYIEDMDNNGVDDLIIFNVDGDRASLYKHFFSYIGGAVKEITDNGLLLSDIGPWPINNLGIYILDAGNKKYLFFNHYVADADASENFYVYAFEGGNTNCLLDVWFYNDPGNQNDLYVVCRTGPDNLMAENRNIKINNFSGKCVYASLNDLNQFYNKGQMLMYYKYIDDEGRNIILQVDDLYSNERSAISDALSYFGIGYPGLSGINGTELVKLLSGNNSLVDHTGWREWLNEGEKTDNILDYLMKTVDSKELNTNIYIEDYAGDIKNENGVVSFNCTRTYSIDVNAARRYLKETKNLSDKEILSLPAFEGYIAVTEELGQDYKQYGYTEASDIYLEELPPGNPYAQELILNTEPLGYLVLSKDAAIKIIDYDDTCESIAVGYDDF